MISGVVSPASSIIRKYSWFFSATGRPPKIPPTERPVPSLNSAIAISFTWIACAVKGVGLSRLERASGSGGFEGVC